MGPEPSAHASQQDLPAVNKSLEGSGDGFVLLDAQWRVACCNAGGRALLAQAREGGAEPAGGDFWTRFPQVEGTPLGRRCREAMERRGAEEFEVFFEPSQAWLEVRVFPEAGGLSVFVRDITGRRREGEALRGLSQRMEERARLLDATLSNLTDLAYSFDREARFTYGNPRVLELLGRPLREIVGKNVFELGYPPELAARLHGQLLEVVATGRPVKGETAMTSAGGVTDYHEYNYNPVFGEDGAVIGVAGSTRYITERKHAEEALRRSEERFRSLSDSAPVPIWMTDTRQNCVWLNRTYLEFTGRTLEEETGRGFEQSIHPDDLGPTLEAFGRCFAAREKFEAEYRVRRHDGRWRWWSCSGMPMHGAGDEFTGYVGTCVDITGRREAQAELERLVAERTHALTETNAQLETLVYSIAHDLRAPLRSMKSFASLLLEEQDRAGDEDSRAYAARIARAAEKMDRLVLDLLAYGRIARSELALAPVETAAAWQTAVQQFETDIATRGARLEASADLPAVRAHEATLGQILANLLGNALKFVPPGRAPHVCFSAEDRGELVRLWVEDNGIGIAPQHQERIFRVFERLHGREYNGTGIGLSIVRKGAERMGGAAGVVSAAGGGARFWVELRKA